MFVQQCTITLEPDSFSELINKEALIDELAEAFIYYVSASQPATTHTHLMNTFSTYLPELYLFCELHDVQEIKLSPKDHFKFTLYFTGTAQADFIRQELEHINYISNIEFPTKIKLNSVAFFIVAGLVLSTTYPIIKQYFFPQASSS